jgi:hypothetical protein
MVLIHSNIDPILIKTVKVEAPECYQSVQILIK